MRKKQKTGGQIEKEMENMTDPNLNILKITLNINSLSMSIKRQRLLHTVMDWIVSSHSLNSHIKFLTSRTLEYYCILSWGI